MDKKKKVNRILAIIALVFVGIFSVSLIMFLFNQAWWNGLFFLLPVISGLIGITMFVIVTVLKKHIEKEELEKEVRETENLPPDKPSDS